MKNVERIIVFGTGALSAAFCAKLPDDIELVAFADNDRSRQGTTYLNREVLPPSRIASTSYDAIIVASVFFDEIFRQLTEHLGIEPGRIRRCPKGLQNPYKSLHPFAHARTRDFGEHILLTIADVLEARGIRYFVDHGTLLGLMRDGGLMPWDDDIDLSVLEDDRDNLLDAIGAIARRLPGQHEAYWSGHFIRQRRGKLLGVAFVFEPRAASDLKPVPTAIWFNSFKHGFAEQFINLAPEHHFRSFDTIDFKGRALSIPANWRDYLTYHYGNWRVPRKDIQFKEIDNYRKHEISVERIPFSFDEYRATAALDHDSRISELRGRFVHRAIRGVVKDAYRQPWIGTSEQAINGKTLVIIPTTACHAQCPGCRTHSSYLDATLAPHMIEAQAIEADLLTLRDLIAVEIARIEGGEPLLHPEIVRVIRSVAQAGIAKDIHLTTSGTVPLSQDVIAACCAANVTIRVLDYQTPENADAVTQFLRSCHDADLKYLRRLVDGRHDTWLSWGGPHTLRNSEDTAVHNTFRRCARNAQWTLASGRFFKCGRVPFDQWTGTHGFSDDDFVDLRSANPATALSEQLRWYLTERSFLDACRSCNGISDQAPSVIADMRSVAPVNAVQELLVAPSNPERARL